MTNPAVLRSARPSRCTGAYICLCVLRCHCSRFSTSVAICCSCGTRRRATRRRPPTRASSRCCANSTRRSSARWPSCTRRRRRGMQRHCLQPTARCQRLQPRHSRHRRRLPLGLGPHRRRRTNPQQQQQRVWRNPLASATRNACGCRFDARAYLRPCNCLALTPHSTRFRCLTNVH